MSSVFFFFKQKTAYEMRISDWSSDVCSSDLFGQVLALGLGAAVISSADLPGVDKMQLGQAFVSDVLGEGVGGALMNTLISASQGEIGRASGRERVCQYV